MAEIHTVDTTQVQQKKSVQYRYLGDEAPPDGRHEASCRETIFELLAGLKVREGMEIDQEKRSMQNYVFKFRKLHGKEQRFRIRSMREGWTKVWRVV